MKIFLYLFVLSASAFAQDCATCFPEFVPDTSTSNLEEFSSTLEHWSANNNQVMNAPCKHKTFDLPLMNQTLEAMTGTKDKKIQGVKFDNENPELLQVFKKLTSKTSNWTWWEKRLYKHDRDVNLQANYQVNPECKKVLCAVDKIWGQYVGRKLLFLNLKFGYNGSELVHANAAKYTDTEMDDLLLAMSDLPQSIMPLGNNREITKYLPSAGHPDKGPHVWADSLMRLYAPWFRGPPGLRFQTLIHELGHNIHYAIAPELNQRWLTMSSWVKTGDKWEFDSVGACMPSRYAMTSPLEDFAETSSAYRYNARALLAQCPDKYNFMRDNVFHGVEYREESQCSGK